MYLININLYKGKTTIYNACSLMEQPTSFIMIY